MIPTILILCDTIQQVATNATSSGTGLSDIGSIASIVGVILAILFFITPIIYKKGILDKLLPYRWRKKYRESITEDLRKDYLKNKIYLQPYITTTHPQASHEPKNTKLDNKELLRDYFINKVFIKESDENNTVFFLFGDSGTGKTAALVHLFNDYLNKHNAFNLPFNIRLISLRREDALNDINSIPKEERKKLILLLDAMDETPEVKDSTQLDSFLNKIKTTFLDFARIVITCRPQFFPDDVQQEIITNPEGILTSTGFLECSIKYLAPFDNQQIQEYLDKAITFRSEDPRRRKAEKIVNMQPAIAIRPLVLSFIKEIVETKRTINTTLDLFDTIIYSILKRDIKKTLGKKKLEEKIKQWWEASSLVAKYMYENNKLNITDSELDKILPPYIEKQFKQRSLLTRYGDEFHFSHKSFYEYFMAYRFFLYPDEIKQVYGMDFAIQLFIELYEAKHLKKEVRFANLQSITNNDIQDSLKNIEKAFASSQVQKVPNNYLEMINHIYSEVRFWEIRGYDLSEKSENSEKEYEEACKRYENAIIKFQTLIKEDPEKYESTIISTSFLLYHTYNKLLDSYRQKAKDDPYNYLPKKAETLNKLICYIGLNQEVYANLSELAQTLYYMAEQYNYWHEFANAEDAAKESLEKFRILAEKRPETFNPWVKCAEELLERIRKEKEAAK